MNQLQYNDGGGSFGGAGGLTWTSSTFAFAVTGTTTMTSLLGSATKLNINSPAAQAGILNFWQASDPKYAITYNNDTTLTIKPTSSDGIAMDLSGNVGIGGAANASYKLYVYGNIYSTGDIIAVGTISGASAFFTNLTVIGSSTFMGDVEMRSNLTVQGYVSSTSLFTGGLPHPPPPDIAEKFPTLQQLEPGDVVALDPYNNQHIIKTNSAYQNNAIGAITTDPNILMGQGIVGEGVALSGRIPTKVSLENGDIAIGDYVAAASEPGKAMKATKSGRVIGVATESFTQQDVVNGKDRIVVFVNPHWWGGGEMAVTENKSGEIVAVISKDDLKTKLSELGINIGDEGTVQVSKLKTEKVITDSIEMKDRISGQTYCLWIENGEIGKSLGPCSIHTVTIQDNNQPSNDESSASSSIPDNQESSSTPSETSSESVSQPVIQEPVVEDPTPAQEVPEQQPTPEPSPEPSPEPAAEPAPAN